MLCGEGFEHRKQWIEDRLQTLSGCFAVSVCGFAVMDNHLHVLVRLDADTVNSWSAEEVVRRWMTAYPRRSATGEDLGVSQAWIDDQTKDEARVTLLRARLANLGWFMKALKEPLARLANKEDECRGTFWESRYKSIAVLDEEALLATCAYIDLNPVAAGIATAPETSPHTSVQQRVEHAAAQGKLAELKTAAGGSVAGSQAAGDVEEGLWLCPIEDRRRQGAQREGLLEGFSLGSYLLLVDYTSRLCRAGKARISREVASILERLGTSAEVWDSGSGSCLRRRVCWAATSARIASGCAKLPSSVACIISIIWSHHLPEGSRRLLSPRVTFLAARSWRRRDDGVHFVGRTFGPPRANLV